MKPNTRRARLTPAGALPGLVLPLATLLAAAPVDASIGDPLSVLPSPASTTADITFHQGSIWVADWESGQLHRVDPSDGRVLETVTAPCHRPEGLASDGALLYVSDYETARILAFDPATGTTIHDYPSPEAAPRGLAWANGSLWLVDEGSDTIYELTPSDGTVRSYFQAPHGSCRGLAHDGRYLWVTDRTRDDLYAVRPEDGVVLFLIKTPGSVPVGLAAGAGGLWLADLQERSLSRLRTETDLPYATTGGLEREMRFRLTLRNGGEGEIATALLAAAVPLDSLENQWLLSPVRYEPTPDEITVDQWGQPVALWRFHHLSPGAGVEVGYSVRVRNAELHYAFYPEDVGPLSAIPESIRVPNLAATSRLELDAELVQRTARDIVGDETNPYWIARKIYDWVRHALEYERVGGWDLPTTLIKRGTGSCSEYAFLYIALCRAAGLPARYEGSVSGGKESGMDDVFHRWCEVYLPNIGWMPVDPSGGDGTWPADHARFFGGLADRFIITTQGSGDSKYLGWNYNGNHEWTYKGRGRVNAEMFGLWSPVGSEEPREAVPVSAP